MIHIDLGNVHFKVVGQELDGLPDSSYPRPTWCLKHLLQGGQVCACSCGREHRSGGLPGTPYSDRQTDPTESQCSSSPHPELQDLLLPLLLAGGGSDRIQSSTPGSSFSGHHLGSAGASRAVEGQCQGTAAPPTPLAQAPALPPAMGEQHQLHCHDAPFQGDAIPWILCQQGHTGTCISPPLPSKFRLTAGGRMPQETGKALFHPHYTIVGLLGFAKKQKKTKQIQTNPKSPLEAV